MNVFQEEGTLNYTSEQYIVTVERRKDNEKEKMRLCGRKHMHKLDG